MTDHRPNNPATGAAQPLVSVLIVTWNRQEDVLEAVQSAYDQAYENVEVIVVDNASTDGTVAALRDRFPDVALIALDENVGAAGGRNPGILAAQGSIVFLLDSDASLGRDTLARVVERFRSEPRLGALTCKIVNAHTGELDPNTWIFTERAKAEQDSEFLSFSFSECGAAIRKEVFDQAGLFWDLLFFGREGEELSLRIWDAGYEIRHFPEALVYHRASPQVRVAGGRREYLDLRNSLYTYAVRHPWGLLLRSALPKVASSLIRGARRRCLGQVLRALADVVRQAPTLRRERRPIGAGTARRYLQMQRTHGSLSWDLVSWLRHKA